MKYYPRFQILCKFITSLIRDPSYKLPITEDLVRDSTKLFFDVVNKMFEKGFTTPEKIAENIDSFLVGITSLTSFDTATVFRFSKPSL